MIQTLSAIAAGLAAYSGGYSQAKGRVRDTAIAVGVLVVAVVIHG